jgi:hypothetical protein
MLRMDSAEVTFDAFQPLAGSSIFSTLLLRVSKRDLGPCVFLCVFRVISRLCV